MYAIRSYYAGWARLRYLDTLGLSDEERTAIRHGNAEAIFPAGAFR